VNQRKPYLLSGIIILSIVVVGFWPSYFGLIFSGNLEAGFVVHLHNAVFLGWVLLLIVQASLVAKNRTDLHKKLGVFGIFLGVLIVIVGVITTLNKVSMGIADGFAVEARQFLLIPLTNMLLFAGFFGAAVYYRKKPKTHKRLMMLATISMLDAPISRMAFLGEPQNPALLMLVWFTPLLVLAISDWMQNRKIPWLYVSGFLILMLSGIKIPLSQSDAWMSIAKLITGG
jgi:hypothetical protein